MNHSEYWIGGLLTCVSLLAATANLALRHMSRLKLQKLLEDHRKTDRLDWLMAVRTEVTLAMAVIRLTANVGVILSMVAIFQPTDGPITGIDMVEALVCSSLLLLLFSVAVPYAWANYAGEIFIVYAMPALRFCRALLRPITIVMEMVDVVVRRLAGVPDESANGANAEGREVVEREILEAVSEGEMQGAVDEEEKEMIESVIELRETHAGQIMTPRTDMVTIDVGATLDEVKELIRREGHSRIPVCDGSLDHINGVLYAKDLLQIQPDQPFDVRQVMRPVPFVPESKSLPDLLHDFQEKKVHVAIVLDEYGGTAGLVTIEDILEELVGEITDEYEPAEPEQLVRVSPDVLEVDGRVRVDEINDELSVYLPEDEDYDTIAGFVFSTLGRIPKVGEELTHENIAIRILDASPRKISRLRVERILSDM